MVIFAHSGGALAKSVKGLCLNRAKLAPTNPDAS